ncbi:MAG: 4Fe-4S dicluster domain-containing protein [Ruminococcaceae bacterium]|nr:4Fe-4S dicluster domain-containing protein [Oscillospiraceae bacterium]
MKGKLGFGCMRMPMDGDDVDHKIFCQMIDVFMENGFHYFDTAKGYLNQKSEIALRECLVKRYPRESFVLTNKLSTSFFSSEEEIRPLFESQLKACGVDYFDFYLMHSQNKELYEKFQNCHAYETALALKEEGKFRHLGISFHDKASMLEKILREHPEIEVVQIQFNYADFEDPSVESRKCYEVCRKFQKPIIVMEPVKGGSLANLPAPAQAIFDELKNGSAASYAIRFAAGFDGIMMVLSGMSSVEMVRENTTYMKNFQPLNKAEQEAIDQVCHIFHSKNLIPCTGCRYCVDGCPKNILIPDLFSCMNNKELWKNWNADYYYWVHTQKNGKAGDCIACGACEEICPQNLPIRELMKQLCQAFDKK